MDQVARHRLGSSRLEITRLAFGGAPIGNLPVALSDADAVGALEAAWNAGIRTFDTAPWYGLGLSEHRMGAFLRNLPREEYVLSTKVGRLLKPWPRHHGPRLRRGPWADPLDFEVRFDYGYSGIMRSFEDSLQRLGVPEVDVLLVHDLDRVYHKPESEYFARLGELTGSGFDALRDLRAAGIVKAIGVGVNMPGVITDMLDRFEVDLFLVAGPYTILEQPILKTELQRCAEMGVGVIIGAAFRYGLIFAGGRERAASLGVDPAILRRAARLDEVCTRAGMPLAAIALQFPLAHPAVDSVVFGAVNAHQVAEVMSWFSTAIPPQLWQELKSEGLVAADAPVPD